MDMDIRCTKEFTEKFEIFDRLVNHTIWNEPTATNLREVSRLAIELAGMIEENGKRDRGN